MKKNTILTLVFILAVTIVFLSATCPLDKWLYIGMGLIAFSFLIVLYKQVKRMEKLTKILDTKIINETKKGGV